MFLENLRIALRAIGANKMRSILTVLGIMIGVAAVIAVVSLVQGMQHEISGQLETVGGTFVRIVPKFPRNPFLPYPLMTAEDADAIARSATVVTAVTPVFLANVVLKSGDTQHDTTMYAVNQSYPDIAKQYVDRGRFFVTLDEETKKRVCVLGFEAAHSLGLDNPIGKNITINGSPYIIVGVMEKRGAALGSDPDDAAYIPFATAQLIYGPDQMKHLPILAQVRNREDMDLAIDQIQEILRNRHHIKKGTDDDFQVTSQEELMKVFSKILNITTGVTGGIVGIALLVGGIGIMNIMLVSVTERTREIGIRKAIGARRRDVMIQFLIEAITLSAVGGVIGILAGYLTALIARLMLKRFVDIPVHIPIWAILVAFGFCALLGIVFGVYPAAKASKLDPIEALRYE